MTRQRSKEDEARRKAEQAFREAERIQESERRLLSEERRHADMLAKTKRLRALRLAKEAAAEAAATEVKPRKRR
jgi:hypothetical protein